VSTEHNRRVLERFDALPGAEDLRELDDLCKPDMVNHSLAPGRPGPGSCLRDFAAMYRFEDGKIAERWAIRDELGMLKQLGAFDADPG